jgi:O-6-methylguanine DNA methyltransferase
VNRARKKLGPLQSVRIPTDLGEFAAAFTDQGLAELCFPDRASVLDEFAGSPSAKAVQQTTQTLLAILSGNAPKRFPVMDLSGGTEFQFAVWQSMLRIPFGKTKSYGEIAQDIDNPNAVRAVGAACGANPVPVIVPCHRVLSAGGMGGFSAGIKWKHRLLGIEGVLTPTLSETLGVRIEELLGQPRPRRPAQKHRPESPRMPRPHAP